MGKKLYVGNLSYTADEVSLKEAFGAHGPVEAVNVIKDPEGRSRGFAFVDMATEEGGSAAIAAMNGADFMGRKLNVSEARPRASGGGGGGGPRGGGGYGGGGGRGGRGEGGGGFRGGGGGGGRGSYNR